MSVDQLKNALLGIGFDKSLIEKNIIKARSGLIGRNPVKEEDVVLPNSQDFEKWAKSFSNELRKANINLSTGKGIDRIKVAENQNGKIVFNNLFDSKKHTDLNKCYRRLKSVLDSNFSVYLYDSGKTYPKEIKQNGMEISCVDAKKTEDLREPKKPNFVKLILNKITFGRVYKDEFSKYEYEKETYKYKCEETEVLSTYEKEREKVAKQEIAEISRVPVDSNKIKFDVELRDKINERQSQRVSDLSKNKSPTQNIRK